MRGWPQQPRGRRYPFGARGPRRARRQRSVGRSACSMSRHWRLLASASSSRPAAVYASVRCCCASSIANECSPKTERTTTSRCIAAIASSSRPAAFWREEQYGCCVVAVAEILRSRCLDRGIASSTRPCARSTLLCSTRIATATARGWPARSAATFARSSSASTGARSMLSRSSSTRARSACAAAVNGRRAVGSPHQSQRRTLGRARKARRRVRPRSPATWSLRTKTSSRANRASAARGSPSASRSRRPRRAARPRRQAALGG